MSVTLNPRTYRRNMANPALLLLPAANLLFIFFPSSVLIILMFSQHLLDDFWKCFEATSSRFKFMHIAYVNSSAQGRMKAGRKDVDMLIWIYAHMCICICILDWLLLPFRRIICIFAFQFADIFLVSFLFFIFCCPKNLIVNKNLPCGKFVMQTNEMRHKRLSERDGERERERGEEKRLIPTAVYYICSNSNYENVCSLNNACDARDFTLTRRYLIELMGKMPSLSLGKHT